MLDPDFLDTLPAEAVELYQEFADGVISDLARRIGNMSYSSAGWQAQRLQEAGLAYQDIIKRVAQLTGKSEAAIRGIFYRAGVRSMRFDEKIYKAVGIDLPLTLSPAMQDVLNIGILKTNGILKNLTLTTALSGQQEFIRASDIAYLEVTSGTRDYNSAIKKAVTSLADRGITSVNYQSGHTDQIDVAVRRNVLTGTQQTAGALQQQRMDEVGVNLVAVSAHAGARPSHQLWQGKVYSRTGRQGKYKDFVTETGYGTGPGLGGWNCVIGDTMVSSLAKRAAYRREYSGELIVIHTAAGKELTVTPYHPILTDHGWVAAKFLDHGDYVICRPALDGSFESSPDVDQSESRIEDVFDSLSVSGAIFDLPISSGNFHGEIPDGKVNVVFSDGFLRDGVDPVIEQELEEVGFGFPARFSSTLISERALPKIVVRSLHASDRIVSGFGEVDSLVGSHSSEPVDHGFRPIFGDRYSEFVEIPSDSPLRYSSFESDFVLPHTRFIHFNQIIRGNIEAPFDISFPVISSVDPVTTQAVLDRMNRTAILIRDELQGVVREVELDYIVSIERKPFTGHVYNLHTEGEWYSANGIITHNCRHSQYPFYEGISENVYNQEMREQLANKTVTLNGVEMSQYDASQVQRGLERKIRFWKRRKIAIDATGLDIDTSVETTKIRYYQSQLREFVRQTKLPRQNVREQVVGQ